MHPRSRSADWHYLLPNPSCCASFGRVYVVLCLLLVSRTPNLDVKSKSRVGHVTRAEKIMIIDKMLNHDWLPRDLIGKRSSLQK
jgi:hypothetical protein